MSVGMAFASERRQIGPEAEEHMSQQEGRMDLFGRTIAIAERHVERLSEQVGTTPVPPELVREAPDSLAATPDQLYAAVEAALRASEARFRDLVEGSLQGVIIVRHFKPLFLNSAYAAMFGYTPRELLALDSTMVLFAPHERPTAPWVSRSASSRRAGPHALRVPGGQKGRYTHLARDASPGHRLERDPRHAGERRRHHRTQVGRGEPPDAPTPAGGGGRPWVAGPGRG